MNYEPFTSIENPTLAHFSHFRHFSSLYFTLAHFRHFSSLFTYLSAYKAADIYVPIRHYICRGFSTNHLLFMQNKPNVKGAQINVNSYMKSKYEKLDIWLSGKNKPNSNPIKPCPERSRMGQSPKSQNERKLNFNKGLQKKR